MIEISKNNINLYTINLDCIIKNFIYLIIKNNSSSIIKVKKIKEDKEENFFQLNTGEQLKLFNNNECFKMLYIESNKSYYSLITDGEIIKIIN